MVTKFVLPLMAVLGLSFAIYTVVQARQPLPPSQPVITPPVRPTSKMKVIAGAGLVEAMKENIPIGVNIPGVVYQIFVKKGDHVKSGAPLFRIDDRELKAQLEVRQAELSSAKAQLHRLEHAPRAEDVPPSEALVEEARARMNDAEAIMARTERLYERQMIAASDFDKDRFAFHAAKATYAKVKADLKRLLAGSWKEDIEVARAALLLAQSQVDNIQTNLERCTVRALADGQILQLNIRLGQFAALAWREPMVVLGDVNHLHVRVDIDENDLPYFRREAPAVATLKGRPHVRFPLKFVYVEPYVIPKQSLTGYNSERVDTRVLQAIYALPDDRKSDVFVGQQMDVYVKAADIAEEFSFDVGPNANIPFETETESAHSYSESSSGAKTPATAPPSPTP
jgi:multidrug resistance efflux pump